MTDSREQTERFAFAEDAKLVTATIIIHSYIREDGSSGYGVEVRGGAPMTTYLGLLSVAKDDILQWRRDDD